MKKVLICATIILLSILAYFIIFRGIAIGNIKILSLEQIKDANDNLSSEIAQTELLMHSTYQTRVSELESSVSKLLKSKKDYLDLAQTSTVGEIKGATQTKEYTLEFLMAKLGNYSKLFGVDLTYTIQSIAGSEINLKNISFKVIGDYDPIRDFISSIEDDTELGFRIYNFKMIPNGDRLQATFITTNVRVKQEVTQNQTTQTVAQPTQQNSSETVKNENGEQQSENNQQQNENSAQNNENDI